MWFANEKTYLDYLWVAWEAEKGEAMETSYSWVTANKSKPRETSFFPLWKLKGSQPAIPPSVQMVHLEEKSTNEEEGISGGSGWHQRCDRRVHCAPAQSSERCSTDREALLSLWQPRPLHLQLLPAGGNQGRFIFKLERGGRTKDGRLSPSRKMAALTMLQDGTPKV